MQTAIQRLTEELDQARRELRAARSKDAEAGVGVDERLAPVHQSTGPIGLLTAEAGAAEVAVEQPWAIAVAITDCERGLVAS